LLPAIQDTVSSSGAGQAAQLVAAGLQAQLRQLEKMVSCCSFSWCTHKNHQPCSTTLFGNRAY
jgi:putative ribosome biogenesis GTPase RsgA